MNKKKLAIKLSKLIPLDKPKIEFEQYQTPSEIAADVLWTAYMNGDIEGKYVADFGCGNGILGIGALLLGAKFVYFIDIDLKNINTAEQNLKNLNLKNFELFHSSIENFNKPVDTILQNPPFGVKNKGADAKFLDQSFLLASSIYSFHKSSTAEFVEKHALDSGFSVKKLKTFDFPLKNQFSYHTKPRKFILVDVWFFKKEKNL